MRKIILASRSEERIALFSSLQIPFAAIGSTINEKDIRHADPREQARLIACAKAENVAAQHDAIIIAGDTFSVCEGKVLEKPRDTVEATEMLEFLSGKNGRTFTGFCYRDPDTIDTKGIFSVGFPIEFVFRKLTRDEIMRYVSECPVTRWSAAFSPAHLYSMTLITWIYGSLTGFTHGLPMEYLIPCLKASKVL